jgi:hypothetical protein
VVNNISFCELIFVVQVLDLFTTILVLVILSIDFLKRLNFEFENIQTLGTNMWYLVSSNEKVNNIEVVSLSDIYILYIGHFFIR